MGSDYMQLGSGRQDKQAPHFRGNACSKLCRAALLQGIKLLKLLQHPASLLLKPAWHKKGKLENAEAQDGCNAEQSSQAPDAACMRAGSSLTCWRLAAGASQTARSAG
jgi:hypothetical protein